MSVVAHSKEAAEVIARYNRNNDFRRFTLMIVPDGVRLVFQNLAVRFQADRLYLWEQLTFSVNNPIIDGIYDLQSEDAAKNGK